MLFTKITICHCYNSHTPTSTLLSHISISLASKWESISSQTTVGRQTSGGGRTESPGLESVSFVARRRVEHRGPKGCRSGWAEVRARYSRRRRPTHGLGSAERRPANKTMVVMDRGGARIPVQRWWSECPGLL
jgi:hypothetical protein